MAPPFITGYWPDQKSLFSELALAPVTVEELEKPETQKEFLLLLANKLAETAVFRPETIGFQWRPADIRFREEFRKHHCAITFLGNCSKRIFINAINAVTQKDVDSHSTLSLYFKGWDILSDWQAGKKFLNEALNHLQTNGYSYDSLMFFSNFENLPADLWECYYDWPQMRIAWTAFELAACKDMASFDQCRQESHSLKNLRKLSGDGISSHVILPATKANAGILPELIRALIELTGDGTVEIMPAPLMSEYAMDMGLSAEEYTAAVLAIYKDSRIPLRNVTLLAWVNERIISDISLINSPEAAGAALGVLPNGDLYAGETFAGQDKWQIGNLLEENNSFRWERLDAIPEIFSTSAMPEACQICDWRYRCGGATPAVLLRTELQAPAERENLFQLYCAPRKALFEEMLWNFVAGLSPVENATTDCTRQNCHDVINSE